MTKQNEVEQWKGKLVPRVRGYGPGLASSTHSLLAAPLAVTTGTEGTGHEARQPQHLEK